MPPAGQMQCHCNVAVRLHLVTEPVKPPGLRAQRLRENEERIVRAAHRLFVERGYAGTPLTAVAEAAGVAPRTVYVRFGTKAALLKRVIDVAVAGDFAPVDVLGRDWYHTATSAPTLEERIAALASGSARLVTAAADVVAVAREAAPTEPLLAEHLAAGRVATREAYRRFWTGARDDGLLPATADLDWLVDSATMLAHIETYLVWQRIRRATAKGYETWMATTFRRLAAAASAAG